jgi:hypothetical protein
MLSTLHTNNNVTKAIRSRQVPGGIRDVEKPVMVADYNSHMSGVDIMDQRLGTYAYPHRCTKWYRTIYHRIREVAMSNGYILHKTVAEREGDRLLTSKQFRKEVIKGLLEDYTRPIARLGRPGLNVPQVIGRLTERHFLGKYDDNTYRPHCTVCNGPPTEGWKRVQTRYYCKQCILPMCRILQ